MAKVSASAKETREKIEWVMATRWAAPLLVLLDTLMAVLIVDATELFVGEHIVSFSDGDEFVMGSLVTSNLILASALSGSLCGYDECA